jgi:hypothetical protein
MFNLVIDHMKNVERELGAISARAAFAFAIGCTERQQAAFERASARSGWTPSGALALWRAVGAARQPVVTGAPLSAALVQALRAEVPASVASSNDAVAHTIANSAIDLVAAIVRHDAK